MNAPHKHANILRALADGKKIQGRLNSSVAWIDVDLLNLAQEPECQFRIAPETITVNGVEVPKPMQPPYDNNNWIVNIEYGTAYTGQRTSYKLLTFLNQADARTVFDALCKPFKEGV